MDILILIKFHLILIKLLVFLTFVFFIQSFYSIQTLIIKIKIYVTQAFKYKLF